MNNFQIPVFQAICIAFILSTALNFITVKLSKNLVIRKKQKQKRLSTSFISPFGGVASSLAFLLSTRLIGKADDNFIFIGIFAFVISLIGVIDDIYNLNWYIKLFFQIVIVSYPLYYLNLFINLEALIGIDLNNNLNFIASTLWVILIINSINFIDNMDGLAVVVSGSICLQIAFLSNYLNQYKLTDISLLLFTTIIGFFIFNFPPAKLYLGDSGSLFIGYCLGFISILFNWTPVNESIYTSVLNPVLLFFIIPLLDFLIVVSYRIKNNIPPTTGGTDHISHRLLAINFSEKKILITFLIYSILCFTLITLSIMTNDITAYLSIFCLLAIFLTTFNMVRKMETLN